VPCGGGLTREENLILWILLVGALLTVSHGKLDYYLLPLYPAAALMVGRYLQVAAWTRGERLFGIPAVRCRGDFHPSSPSGDARSLEWRPHPVRMFGVAHPGCGSLLFSRSSASARHCTQAFVLSVWLAWKL
jgi:hypothetical protein